VQIATRHTALKLGNACYHSVQNILSSTLASNNVKIKIYRNTGCGRNSELIINKNNILLKVIDINFSTSQFTMVLNFFLHGFTFCVQCLLGGHHPPQCTGAHELSSCT
jgi:hypothetical protein